ncbi:MAG: N-acetyltransferase family protein [Halobacteriaceae archaeon]
MSATEPDTAAADREFPRPPLSFTDGEGREVTVRTADDDLAGLVAMYGQFGDGDRAQGLPPRGESRIRSWLAGLLDEGVHLVAVHGDRVVGHAALLPMGERHELVVFVEPAYQLAGIGTRLVRALLGEGQRRGVEAVWLTVHRHNRVAKRLYRSVGFRAVSRGREWEMERPL